MGRHTGWPKEAQLWYFKRITFFLRFLNSVQFQYFTKGAQTIFNDSKTTGGGFLLTIQKKRQYVGEWSKLEFSKFAFLIILVLLGDTLEKQKERTLQISLKTLVDAEPLPVKLLPVGREEIPCWICQKEFRIGVGFREFGRNSYCILHLVASSN